MKRLMDLCLPGLMADKSWSTARVALARALSRSSNVSPSLDPIGSALST